jgi:hypothetical protein
VHTGLLVLIAAAICFLLVAFETSSAQHDLPTSSCEKEA